MLGGVRSAQGESAEQHKSRWLQNFIRDNVEKGATVCTDDYRGCMGLQNYSDETVKYSAKEFVNGMAHTNEIENVWAVLKKGYNGTL